MRRLETGKRLQLLIAAADNLATTLAPLRSRRTLRAAKMAAGLGGATSVLTGGALLAANIGFWSSVGLALGLGSIPLLFAAGSGAIALGLRRKDGEIDEITRRRVALTFSCFTRMANADGRISEEERTLLEAALLQHPLDQEEREVIQSLANQPLASAAADFDREVRRQVLEGTWLLAEADGVAKEEEQCFVELAQELGLPDELRDLKRASRARQGELNDLITAMFRTSQYIVAPQLGSANANSFLECLAQIAATPQVRRSLRNSLSGGFSAGGVAQTIGTHGQAQKLIAQAGNAMVSIYDDGAERKEAEARLWELAEGSPFGRRQAKQVYDDVKALFCEMEEDG